MWKIIECPECGSKNLIEDFDRGEIICQNCGLVTNENVIYGGPEWRAYSYEEGESKKRVGTPLSYSIPDKGLSTIIDRVNRDSYGRQLPISKRIEMQKLRRLQIRTVLRPSINKNLALAMLELDRLSDYLHIPNQIKEKAAIIYRKALESGLVRGRSIAAVMAASLYASCRANRIPRTLKEFVFSSNIEKKDIASCYRLLLKELEIKMPIDDPMICVSKIASKARIPINVQGLALKILKEAKKKGAISGKEPMGLAAAALYLACKIEGLKRTQSKIAEVANVTEASIRNRYKNLKEIFQN
jgi:transcription initiation factor TFIIB